MTRVLMVDDARLLAEVDGTALARSTFQVRVAGPAIDIVRAAEETSPAVVVLGEGESCPDALEVCRRLRATPATRTVGIIYIGVGLNRERSIAAGADIFIPRPFTRLEFREALHRVLQLKDRLAVRRQVELAVDIAVGEAAIDGTCRDLSLSGAFVVADRGLRPGERGTLRFRAGGRTVQLPVEVVRHGPGACGAEGFGLAFLDLDADIGAFLSRFVRTAGNRRQGPDAPPSPEATP